MFNIILSRPFQTAFFTLVLAYSVTVAQAAPKSDLWEKWTVHDPSSTERIDHSAWTQFLQKHLKIHPSGVNLIDYGGVGGNDIASLQSYIDGLSMLDISSFNRAEQFSYWVNLYNALTVKVVLDNYPVRSIRDIKSGLFTSGPWGKELVTIEGEAVTLDDIEHRILRPIWKDPRIHYAVNCASIGCPNLQPVAFTAENTQDLLDNAAREFINHPRGFAVSRNRLIVSSIYDWFKSDFGGNDNGVIEHLKQYATPERASLLADVNKVSDDRYDWSLNDSNLTRARQKSQRLQGGGS